MTLTALRNSSRIALAIRVVSHKACGSKRELTSSLLPAILLASFCTLFPQQSYAWTAEITAAFQAIADGDATDPQKALAFRSYKELGMMAKLGEISLSDYNKVQPVIADKILELGDEATKIAGVGSKMQTTAPGKLPQPGADVDIHGFRLDNQQITAKDIANARQAFDDLANAYLRANGQKPLENPSKQLNTDITPVENPSQPLTTAPTPQEFAAAGPGRARGATIGRQSRRKTRQFHLRHR